MKIRHLIPALGMLITISCKTAAPAAPDRFAQADANHDNKISRDEMSDYLVISVFPSLDTNNDKKLSREEANASHDPSLAKSFRERDANKDGFITLEEAVIFARHRKSYDAVFIEADKDKNHFLSRPEIIAYYASKEGPAR